MIHPWQQKIFDKIVSGGIEPGELQVMSSGRQLGKSAFSAQALQRIMDDLQNKPVEELNLSEGTVYGARYYTVEPVGGNWSAMETWCLETFGSGDKPIWGEDQIPEPAQRWYMNNRKFWFRDEKDRMLFVLKWR